MSRTSPVTRRSLLRGSGAVLALPLLECMPLPAQETGKNGAANEQTPRRAVWMKIPDGVCNEAWYPQQTGSQYELSPTLASLAPVKKQFTVLSGLGHPRVTGEHKAHHFLTGQPTGKLGVSVDQVAAKALGRATRFPSLILGLSDKPGITLSYNHDLVPLPGYYDAEALFNRLFVPETAEAKQAKLRRLHEERSILDDLREQYKSVHKHLGKRDQERLDQYLHSIREVELQITQQQLFMDKPKVDENPVKGGIESPTRGRTQRTRAYYRAMYALIRMALQTDSTRIVAWNVCSEVSADNFGEGPGRHSCSHHGGKKELLDALARIDKIYIEELSLFLQGLQDIDEGGTSLLDSTMVFYGSCLNNGTQYKNGRGGHSNALLPLLFAGGGRFGYQHGRHLRFDRDPKQPYKNPPLCNVYLDMLQNLGVKTESFADSTGNLPALRQA